jgi:hypothetical protein
MFHVPPLIDTVLDGCDDEHPLYLEGYLAEDFRRLLRVLLPLWVRSYDTLIVNSLCFRQHGISPPLAANEWVSVLKLSTIWGFRSVRSTAIESLATYAAEDPILKVVLSKQYSVSNWFVSGLNALAQRTEALTFTDFERFKEIGSNDYVVDFLLRISCVRESYIITQQQPYCNYHYSRTCGCYRAPLTSVAMVSRSDYDFSTSIRDVFATDIKSLEG